MMEATQSFPLKELLQTLPMAEVVGVLPDKIGKIACDSREADFGDLFVAIRGGEEKDRHDFIPQALARGVGAVVAERRMPTGNTPLIVVDNCRLALAQMAARYFEYPDRQLSMVGVTGTNGKTTTALILRSVLEAAGRKCGYVGTLGVAIDKEIKKGRNTTPEAFELYQLLNRMVIAGNVAAVLEVSSHALALGRVTGMHFGVAVFTNLTRDHLDFHGSVESYLAAKLRLFEERPEFNEGQAVINVDDPSARVLLDCLRVPALTYGYDVNADVRMRSAVPSERGTAIELDTPDGDIVLDVRLVGYFNFYNVMAAFTCGLVMGLDADSIRAGIEAVDNVPGRFERIELGQNFQVIVDYAHTPDALERVLTAARDLANERLLCVFGCGGDRDRGKRPEMGRIAFGLADKLYVTSDNPRSENPNDIIDEILTGVGARGEVIKEPARLEAVRNALGDAREGDLVVIAGKGHEVEQIIGDEVLVFDDRQVARETLRAMGHGNYRPEL